MSKRFYLSTRLDRSGQAADLLDRLKARGWERTLEWEINEPSTTEGFSRLAVAQLEAIGESDIVIVLLPGGRGTYAEVGAALALGKPIILYSPDRETLDKPYPCTFHYHPKVTVVVSERLDLQQVLASIEELTLLHE